MKASDKETLSGIGIRNPCFKLTNVNYLISKKILAQPLDGNHGEIHPKGNDFVDEGIPFIMASDIKRGHINFHDCKFIRKQQADNLRKGFSKIGDILLTHKATIGETAIVNYRKTPYIMLTPQVTYYRVINDSKLSRHYLFHYFNSQYFQDTLKLWAGAGSTRAYLGITAQKKLPIIITSLSIQRKIAAVLSAYDDLIENNNRRIAILARMAEELYREWFVRLRFPGHEKIKIVKGVPEGWEVKTLGEICFEERKLIKKKNISDETRYIGLEHISPRTIITKDYGYAVDIYSDKLVFSQLDILFGKIRPYLHKVSIAHFNGVCSSDIIVIKSRRQENQAFVCLTVSSNSFIELATTASTGTKMPRADWAFLIKQKIIYPEIGILKQFQKIFDNSLSAISNYQKRNEMLQHSRDRLLSRLMSGNIDLENLDIQFPNNMKEEAAANA